MIKVDVISGFLGAGKTTLIRKLLNEALMGQRLAIIENEFGQVGIDGSFLADTGIAIRELNAGCICCSLTGDFRAALREVAQRYEPERIIIEPSGVGKLTDVAAAVESAADAGLRINSLTTVVDAVRCRMQARSFGEFFNDQVRAAGCLILSRTGQARELAEVEAFLRGCNPDAVLVTTPWDELTGAALLDAMERRDTLAQALRALQEAAGVCPVCGCAHDHEHDHDHEHAHHEHDHGHHAGEVFTSWGMETRRSWTPAGLRGALEALTDAARYGTVLRAKGVLPCCDGGGWLHFDYVSGAAEVRRGAAAVTGRLCVIGTGLRTQALTALWTEG